jgi:hypothetical protein
MTAKLGLLGAAIALLMTPSLAAAQEKKNEKDNDPLAVIALGAAGEWGFPGSKFSRGPSAAVEFSLIKDWVEVEIGGARLFRRGVAEWEGEVVFRKPFTLSETTEFMIGLGPIWTKASGEPTKLGTTFMADFMFWSSPEKKYGWFIEPSYSVSGGERSLGVSVGLIFGIH